MVWFELGAAQAATGGYGKAANNEAELSAVAAGTWKPGEREKFQKAIALGAPVGAMGKNGVGADTALAYLDNESSGAFRKRLDDDLARLGGRTAPTAGKTAIGPGGKMASATLGPAATMSGATLNLGDDAAARAQQAKAIAELRGRAAGTAMAPGVAQLYASLGKSNAAMTAAASGRPGNAGMAARSLASRTANAGQAAAGNAAILKTQDQLAAQDALSNMVTAARSADMQGAQTQAGLNQNASLFSADALNKFGLARAAGDQSASMFNAGVEQEQYGMDQDIALANMRAYLQNQGLNDAAINARMSMYQDAINKEKRDRMAFNDFAAGGDRFNSSMSWANQQYNDAQEAARWAGAAQAVGGMGMAYASQPDEPKKYGGGDAQYGSDGKRTIVTTSDARAKRDIKPGSPVLRAWLDQMGGR